MPAACSACRAPSLTLEGLGTERLEDVLAELLPAARIARLDRDVATGQGSERILDRMRESYAEARAAIESKKA